MDTTEKKELDPQDRALLLEAQRDLLDLQQALVPGGETPLTDLLFQQLGVVTWWLERAKGQMPERNRVAIREGMIEERSGLPLILATTDWDW